MISIEQPISIAGALLGETRHVCAFFSSRDEEYRVLLPFIREGFDRGDKAVHVLNPDRHDDHLHRLTAAGIDPRSAQETRQLQLRANTETYLRDGRFDQERLVAAFEQMASANARDGIPLRRIVCNMEWASGDQSRIDEVVEFESRVNDVWRRHHDAIICSYDLGSLGGGTVVDIIRTHPMVIMGGILQENPFFVPPQQFLLELRERRARRAKQALPDTTAV
jgi:hypothetical protein